MNNQPVNEKIRAALDEFFVETDCFLVDIKWPSPSKIEVYIDCMAANVTIERCGQTSRHLEAMLEEQQLVPENYTLDVSSPGMFNAFKVPQQFQKSIGREVEVLATDGIKRVGRLASYADGVFTIEEEKAGKKKKGQVPEVVTHRYQLDEVKAVKKVFSFPK